MYFIDEAGRYFNKYIIRIINKLVLAGISISRY